MTVKGKEIWSNSSKESNDFFKRDSLICDLGFGPELLPVTGVTLPSILIAVAFCTPLCGFHCVISRTWCHQQRHCITKTSESCPKPNEIDGTKVFSIPEYTSKYRLRKHTNGCPKEKRKKDRTQLHSDDTL